MKAKKEMSVKKLVTLVCVIFWVVSAVFIVCGIFSLKFYDIKGRKCTEEVQATVIRNDATYGTSKTTKRGTKETLMYKPVYQYEYGGRIYVQVSSSSSSKKIFEVGDVVSVRVNPNDPDDYFCPEDKTTSILGYIFIGVSIFMMLLSTLIYVVFRKAAKDEWNKSEEEDTDYTQLPEYTGR